MYGTKGEDVKLMQKLLNLVNDQNRFYEGRLPEDGFFDMFRTRVCLSKFQDWCEVARTYCYEPDTHGMLITAVNTILAAKNTPGYLFYCK
jgi:hypothetical protein